MTFEFKITPKLRELAAHAIANHEHQRAVYTKDEKLEKPALMIVKDSGAYLMSCFTSKDAPKEARLWENDKNLSVVYAEGCTPEDEWIGGDDYGCDLPGLPIMILRSPKSRSVIVDVRRDYVVFSVR